MAELYVSCDCPDTDFVVRVCYVDENGRSVKLADGVIGAKFNRVRPHELKSCAKASDCPVFNRRFFC